MWQSHFKATPPNAPLFYGPFASDPELYTAELLTGFDSWLGVGQLLVVPQLTEGARTREVYFPKSSPYDKSVYFDISNHLDYRTQAAQVADQQDLDQNPDIRAMLNDRLEIGYHPAGTKTTIYTPLEHAGLFARQGSVIPVGKPTATVTTLSGPGRRYPDGVDVNLVSEGGQVSPDDWRGVMIFPPPASTKRKRNGSKVYTGSWIEDDGITTIPTTYTVEVKYWVDEDGRLVVEARTLKMANGFEPIWRGEWDGLRELVEDFVDEGRGFVMDDVEGWVARVDGGEKVEDVVLGVVGDGGGHVNTGDGESKEGEEKEEKREMTPEQQELSDRLKEVIEAWKKASRELSPWLDERAEEAMGRGGLQVED